MLILVNFFVVSVSQVRYHGSWPRARSKRTGRPSAQDAPVTVEQIL